MRLARTLPPRGGSTVDGYPVGIVAAPTGVMLILDVSVPGPWSVVVDEPEAIPDVPGGVFIGAVTYDDATVAAVIA